MYMYMYIAVSGSRQKSTPKKLSSSSGDKSIESVHDTLTNDRIASVMGGTTLLSSSTTSSSTSSLFDFVHCCASLVRVSDTWSIREIRKVIQNIQSSVLGTDKYVTDVTDVTDFFIVSCVLLLPMYLLIEFVLCIV